MNDIWDITKINDYLDNQIEESLNLDYKAAEALSKSEGKKKEISKDISAMANSDGGKIIYGIKEFDEQEKRYLPEKIDPINRNDYPKEWLEQVINSNIHPKINNVIIHPITVEQNTNGVIYVVEIPKSDTAHQAKDFRYYKRYNFESVPMDDYEIRDIMGRRKNPKIQAEFKINISRVTKKHLDLGPSMVRKNEFEDIYELNIYGKNSGKIFAKYVTCFIDIPVQMFNEEQLREYNIIKKDDGEYVQFVCNNTERDIVDVKMLLEPIYKYGPARYTPILPRLSKLLKSIKISDNFKDKLDDLIIQWVVFADNAEPIADKLFIKEIKIIDERTNTK